MINLEHCGINTGSTETAGDKMAAASAASSARGRLLPSLASLPPSFLHRFLSSQAFSWAQLDLGPGGRRAAEDGAQLPTDASGDAAPAKPHISQKVRFIDKLRMQVHGGHGGSGSVSFLPKGMSAPVDGQQMQAMFALVLQGARILVCYV